MRTAARLPRPGLLHWIAIAISTSISISISISIGIGIGVVMATATAHGKAPAVAPERAIRVVLDLQVTAWNRHDLEGYMAGYWRSPELRFFAGDKATRGWQETLDRYRQRYQADGKEMGQLVMKDVEVQVLSPTHAFVRGAWHLTFSDGKTAGGLYTLLMQKRAEGWRVVHDHSS